MALATSQINLNPIEVFAIDRAIKQQITGAASRNEFVRQAVSLATLSLTTEFPNPWRKPCFGEPAYLYPQTVPGSARWLKGLPKEAYSRWRMPPVRILDHQVREVDAIVRADYAPSREAFVRKAVRYYLGLSFAERTYDPATHNLPIPRPPGPSSTER